MTQEQHIKELLSRYINNSSTPQDIEELDKLFADPKHEELLKELLQEQYYSIRDGASDNRSGAEVKDKIYDYVVSHEQETVGKRTKKQWWSKVAAAVAVVLTLGAGIVFYQQSRPTADQIAHTTEDIQPGGNKAYLTLANGQRISLSDAANGDVAQQDGIIIRKTADGELVYEITEIGDANDEIKYNTIETPNGGQYQIRLPDGTSVWLNAASRLKYPTSFSTVGERRVQLDGEGYFEVAKDSKRPFIVVSQDQQVQVLGTHFNINAYDDEGNIVTTLLEGSVKVGNMNQEAKVLTPGQQSVNTGGNLQVSAVNTDFATDWKDGYFRFNDKSLEVGLREIARWYNVDVIYEDESLKAEPLAGRISKYDNISQVLKKMELAGIFHFSIEGRKIIVK